MKKSIEILALATALFVILFVNIIFSNPDSLFETPRKCSDVWGGEFCNSTTLDDSFKGSGGLNGTQPNGCNGTQYWKNGGIWSYVSEVYINATDFFPDSEIDATCEFKQHGAATNFEYLWYYNTSNWINIENWTDDTQNFSGINKSASFKLNSTEGMHIIRCIISYNFSPPVGYDGQIPNECANNTTSSYYDNDDVNFTVTNHLTYDYWNLTNYTTGANITNGGTYNRSNSGNITYINVSAHWNKLLYNAWIEHNGTGTWQNYTISNFTGNWTNYTLNLSNASEFNTQIIGIRAIYANDTFSVTNSTSPYLYFNLSINSAPNITSYWFSPSTNRTNLHTNLTIYSNVSDNVGIFAVNTNITYPSNISFTITNFTGNPSPENQTWSFTFDPENITLNETGNYTVWWVKVINGGSLESNITQNLTFYVTNNLAINTSIVSDPSNPILDQYYTLNTSVFDVNNEYHQFPVNLTVTCGGQTYNPQNYSQNGNLLNINQSTNFSYCKSPSNYGSFDVTINVSDAYNNTAQQTFTFSTVSAPSSGSGGGGGGFTPETKKCSDKTPYSQCSSQKPFYCSNGTLINKCSVCGCNNTDYGCQADGSCILVKKEDFDFETNITSIEMRQGEDNELVIGILKNTGNTILNLKTFLNVSQDCCNISIPSAIILNEKEEKEFSLSIHVPLSTNVSEYLVNIGIRTSTFKKERSITVSVSKSPYYTSLEDIGTELSNIEKEIQDYKKAGVDVGNLENTLENAKIKLNNANSSASTDQLNVLTGYISDITGDVSSVQSSLNNIRTQIFFSQVTWIVLLLIVSSFLTAYMVPEVLMPLYKIEKDVRNLKEEEKILISSRVETEKLYFLRKMDENTFSKIMIGKQDKILKTKASIKEKEDETKKIIENRLKPKGIANTMKEKFDKVFKKKNEK